MVDATQAPTSIVLVDTPARAEASDCERSRRTRHARTNKRNKRGETASAAIAHRFHVRAECASQGRSMRATGVASKRGLMVGAMMSAFRITACSAPMRSFALEAHATQSMTAALRLTKPISRCVATSTWGGVCKFRGPRATRRSWLHVAATAVRGVSGVFRRAETVRCDVAPCVANSTKTAPRGGTAS
jgi:hypothetical protein